MTIFWYFVSAIVFVNILVIAGGWHMNNEKYSGTSETKDGEQDANTP